MKKKINKPMRAAGVLLVATMLSTCLTAGTFAKYTTTDSATDTARVAKFGVTISMNGNLYANAYEPVGSGNTPKFIANADAKGTETVRSYNDGTILSGNQNVVAPGTKNDNGLGIMINGCPEVDVKFDTEIVTESIFLKGDATNPVNYGVMVKKPAGAVTAANFATLNTTETLYTKTGTTYSPAAAFDGTATYYVLKNTVTADTTYYPVVYKLVDTTTGGSASYAASASTEVSTDTLKGVADQIVKQLNGNTSVAPTVSGTVSTYTVPAYNVKHNTDLGDNTTGLNIDGSKITWEWSYERGTTAAEKAKYDGLDTILGDLMATKSGDANFTAYGEVVKQSGTDYVLLTEGTDYNLKTKFEIGVTATQID